MTIILVILTQVFAYLGASAFFALPNGNDPRPALGVTSAWLLQLAWVVLSPASARLERSLMFPGVIGAFVFMVIIIGAIARHRELQHEGAVQPKP